MNSIKKVFYDSESLTAKTQQRWGDPNNEPSENEIQTKNWKLGARVFTSQLTFFESMTATAIGIVGLLLTKKTQGFRQKALFTVSLLTFLRPAINPTRVAKFEKIINPNISLKRTIQIQASIDDVYDFLSNFSNYCRFMSFIQHVEVGEHGQLHWIIRGPAGLHFHWNTNVEKMIRNTVICWKSEPSSPFQTSGEIQFKDLHHDGTLVQIILNYTPPMGVLGYGAVQLLDFDPKEKIDEDLEVLKSIFQAKTFPFQNPKEKLRA